MSRSAPANPSSFPHWVALSSLGLVLWLFFGNTAPAVRERTELRALAEELSQLRRQYDAAIAETRLGRVGSATCDLQTLLVAVDQCGYTLAELCAAYPQSQAAQSQAEDRSREDGGPADGTDAAAPSRTKFQ